MIYGIYSVLDSKSEYIAISLDQNDETAMRSFKFALSQPGSMMSRFPEDYRLFKIGEFDTATAQIDPFIKPEFIMQGEKNE